MHAFHDQVGLGDSPTVHPRRWTRWIATLVLAVAAVVPQGVAAQGNEAAARGFASSVAAVVYKLAWPSATYEGFSLAGVRPVSGGYDVGLRIYGESAFFGSSLWMELVLQFRKGSLSDIRVMNHNALFRPPFATTRALAKLLAEVARATSEPAAGPRGPSSTMSDHAANSALLGTWRDENSVFTYGPTGRWSAVWDSGSSASGSWSVRDGVLTWRFDTGTVARYRLTRISGNQHTFVSLDSGTRWTAHRIP